MTQPQQDDAHFELSFSPNEQLETLVRRFVTSFYDQLLDDPEVTARVAIATHELLENAVRYSSDGRTRIRVGVHRENATSFTVTIDTSNHTTEEHLRRLAGRAGVGHGRIRAEAGMTLTHRVEGDHVHLQAHARFEGTAGQRH